jgi:predicted nucleotidyltransferase
MVDSALLSGVRRYLRQVDRDGIPVTLGVVFGSHARGQADLWSDIDVLVVSPSFDADTTRDDVGKLWRIAAAVDSRIEPIPCGDQLWHHGSMSAVIEAARQEGVVVPLESDVD